MLHILAFCAGPAFRRVRVQLLSLCGALLMLALWPACASALELRGVVESVVPRVQSLQVLDSATGQSAVVSLSKDVEFVNAKSLQDFQVNDIVIVEMQPGQPATRLVRAVVPIGPEQTLGVEDVTSLLNSGKPYLLVDSRPPMAFDEGHIPTAVSIYVDELPKHWDKLPVDKNQLVVFYCTGST
jgi:hypothetical protein